MPILKDKESVISLAQRYHISRVAIYRILKADRYRQSVADFLIELLGK